MTFLPPSITPRPSTGDLGVKKYQEAFKVVTAASPAALEAAVQSYLDILAAAPQAAYIKHMSTFTSPASGNNTNYHTSINYAVVAAPTTLPL